MSRILLITFYYPPYTGIEGNRLKSWAKSLCDAGYDVTVVTRQWKAGGQTAWKDYTAEYREAEEQTEQVSDRLRIVRLPHTWSQAYRKAQASPLSPLYYWWSKSRGKFHIETDAYSSYMNYCSELLGREHFDICIVSAPPLNVIRLGHELSKKFGLPYIADFRDSYNNFLLNPAIKPSAAQKAENFFFKKHLNRWLKNAAAIVTVAREVTDLINPAFAQPVVIVRNGFEEHLFDAIPITDDTDTFTISLTGSLYPEQDVAFFCKGVQQFIEKEKPNRFTVKFIGIKSKTTITSIIRRYIPERYLYFTDRILREDALKIMRSSQLLFQVGWRGYKGLCPGKVFEYMAAGRNILVAPSDDGLTDKLIGETGTGYSAKTIDDVSAYLTAQYRYWEANGAVSYAGRKDEIMKYSREAQNKGLIDCINLLLEKGVGAG